MNRAFTTGGWSNCHANANEMLIPCAYMYTYTAYYVPTTPSTSTTQPVILARLSRTLLVVVKKPRDLPLTARILLLCLLAFFALLCKKERQSVGKKGLTVIPTTLKYIHTHRAETRPISRNIWKNINTELKQTKYAILRTTTLNRPAAGTASRRKLTLCEVSTATHSLSRTLRWNVSVTMKYSFCLANTQ